MSIQDIFNKKIDLEFFTPPGDKGYSGDRGPVGQKGNQGDSGASAPDWVECGYGVCKTGLSNLNKIVTIPDYINTVNGITVIRFTHPVKANATLNINSTGDLPINIRASLRGQKVPIKDGIIFGGTTATFICDGESYILISVDYNDYSYLPTNGEWKIMYPSGNEACWTRYSRSIVFQVGESEKLTTFDFPFEFVWPPNVLISISVIQYSQTGTCSAEIVELTTSKVILNVKREKTTSSVSVLIGIRAEI